MPTETEELLEHHRARREQLSRQRGPFYFYLPSAATRVGNVFAVLSMAVAAWTIYRAIDSPQPLYLVLALMSGLIIVTQLYLMYLGYRRFRWLRTTPEGALLLRIRKMWKLYQAGLRQGRYDLVAREELYHAFREITTRITLKMIPMPIIDADGQEQWVTVWQPGDSIERLTADVLRLNALLLAPEALHQSPPAT